MNRLNAILVMLGGGTGAVCRILSNQYITDWADIGFPLGILLVNIIGCFAMGVLQGSMKRWKLISSQCYALLGTGFLGGFTTFSTFSVDCVKLWSNGSPIFAVINIICTVILCLIAVFVGWRLAAPHTQKI